jgi:hypothetical protein
MEYNKPKYYKENRIKMMEKYNAFIDRGNLATARSGHNISQTAAVTADSRMSHWR